MANEFVTFFMRFYFKKTEHLKSRSITVFDPIKDLFFPLLFELSVTLKNPEVHL